MSAIQTALFVYGVTMVISMGVAVLIRILYAVVRGMTVRKQKGGGL